MKSLIRRLTRVRHAVYGALLQGVLTALAGLYFQAQHVPNLQMSPVFLIVLGGAVAVLATAAAISTYVVDPVLEGVVVDVQQPQLPDVRTHTRRTPELPQAA